MDQTPSFDKEPTGEEDPNQKEDPAETKKKQLLQRVQGLIDTTSSCVFDYICQVSQHSPAPSCIAQHEPGRLSSVPVLTMPGYWQAHVGQKCRPCSSSVRCLSVSHSMPAPVAHMRAWLKQHAAFMLH